LVANICTNYMELGLPQLQIATQEQ